MSNLRVRNKKLKGTLHHNSHVCKWYRKENKRLHDCVNKTLTIIEYLEDLIKCQSCKNGRSIGEGGGYSECDCGNDGHRLYGMEGERISELLDYTKLTNPEE